MLFGGEDVPDSLGSFWTQTFPTFSDKPYHDPQGGFFPFQTGEPSGGACASTATDDAQNAFYWDGDESIAYDATWLDSLLADNGPAGPMTILAPRVGPPHPEPGGLAPDLEAG